VRLLAICLQAILAQLREEDEMSQLAGLTELCEYLSISTEDTLAAFPTEQAVPLLVGVAGRQCTAAVVHALDASVKVVFHYFQRSTFSFRQGCITKICGWIDCQPWRTFSAALPAPSVTEPTLPPSSLAPTGHLPGL
jgi:hypothetical protein